MSARKRKSTEATSRLQDSTEKIEEDKDSTISNDSTSSSTICTEATSAPIEISLKPSPNIPAFLTKLYNMVSDKNSNNLIRWSTDGTSFIVEHQEEFAQKVLPRFFKHNNFSSFVRQLNMYGFHKVQHVLSGSLSLSSDPETWEFSNDNFQFKHPELLINVKRKSPKNVASVQLHDYHISAPKNNNSSQNNNIHDLNNHRGPALHEIHAVIGELNSIKQAQQSISQDLQQLRAQNQLLWQESLQQRKKHEQQQQVIQKILTFLVSVVSSDKLKSTIDGAHSNGSPRQIPLAKKRKLLTGPFSSDDDEFSNLLPEDELSQEKIVELFHTPINDSLETFTNDLSEPSNEIVHSDAFLDIPSIPSQQQQLALLRNQNVNNIYNPRYPSTQNTQNNSNTYNVNYLNNPNEIATNAIEQDIDLLQDNLDSITDYLGLGTKDLGAISDADVDAFLQNYISLEDGNINNTQ